MSGAGMNPAVLSAQYSAVPDEITSSKRPKAMPMSVRGVAIPSSSGTQTSGGQLLFQLSSKTSFIKPGSMYLKARISLTAAGNANGANAAFVAFSNQCRNASSIIDKFTVSCGPVLESIQNYGSSYVPTLLLHAGSQSYINADDGLLEGGKRSLYLPANGVGAYPLYPSLGYTSTVTNQWVDLDAACTAANVALANTFIDVCLPIYSNLFQNEKAVPLALFEQALLLQFDLAPFGKAFSITYANLYSDYSVSSAFIVYDLITPPNEFLMTTKAEMAQGALYSIPFVSVLSSQFAKGGQSTTFNWGVGLSSLLAVTYSCLVAPTVVTDAKYLMSDNTIGVTTNNNFRLMIDGQQQQSAIMDTSAIRFAELQKCFGTLGDVSRTSSSTGLLVAGMPGQFTITPQLYENSCFVGGLNTTKCQENLAFTGTACNQISLMLDTGNANTTLVLCNAWHQRILVCSPDGSVSIVL